MYIVQMPNGQYYKGTISWLGHKRWFTQPRERAALLTQIQAVEVAVECRGIVCIK